MIRVKLCTVAESIIVDGQTNTPSIINVLEGIQVESVPFYFPRLSMFVLWERDLEDPAQYDAVFQVQVGDQEVLHQPILVDFIDKPRCRTQIQTSAIPIFDAATTVTFSIRLNDIDITASYSFSVDVREAE
ncbi:hypothetical protein [Herbaspirillum aquaticum]|uniref:hypothetical protein n=1 Tax=Herbaspirillum aquaticum TaxID=568783 RepID=UPI0024DDFAAF|nr:hypothetical protein [Herbaspirillum aquaticum]